MAITVTSKYKPFTYEELVKPLEEYWKDYDAHEEALSNTELAASTLEYIINAEPEGSPLKDSYSNFRKKLTEATNALANGVDASDRALLRELKSTFARDINPIEINYKKLQDLISEQRKAKQANNSVRFSRDAHTISVGELMQNPNLSYESYVGDQITADAINMLTPLSKVITGISNNQLIPGYDSVLENLGLTVADVQSYLNNPDNPNIKFKKIIDNALRIAVDNSGVQNWGNEAALADAYNFAKQGIYSTIGSVKSQHFKHAKSPKDDSDTSSDKDKDPVDGLRGASLSWTTQTPVNQSQSSRGEAEENNKFVASIYMKPNGGYSSKGLDDANVSLEIAAKALGLSSTDAPLYINFYNKQNAAAKSSKARTAEGVMSARANVAKTYASRLGMTAGQLMETITDPDGKAKALVNAYVNRENEKQKITEVLTPYRKASYSSDGLANVLNLVDDPKKKLTIEEGTDKILTYINHQKSSDTPSKTPFGTDALTQAKKEALYQDSKTTKLAYQATPLYAPEVESKVLKKIAAGISQLLATGQSKDVTNTDTPQNIKKSGSKGVYKIDYNNNTLTKTSSDEADKLQQKLNDGNGHLIFDTNYGLVVSSGGTNYAIVGVNQTKVFDNIVAIGQLLSDIGTEDYLKYKKQARNKGDYLMVISPELMNPTQQGNLYKELSYDQFLVSDGNLQYAYVYLSTTPGDPLVLRDEGNNKELVKVVFTNEGRYLGVSSLDDEMQASTPMSVRVMQRLMNEAGYDLVSNSINLSTSPAPNLKDNLTSQYY